MAALKTIKIARDCPAMMIPSGQVVKLDEGGTVFLYQELGSSITVRTPMGALLRVDGEHADALGMLPPGRAVQLVGSQEFSEELVEQALDTVYDPEIPVSVLQLGLIYRHETIMLEDGRRRIEIDMSMTAPGCGMADVLRDDARRAIEALPDVDEVLVDLVWDPPWSSERMSEIARLELGML